eukprot:SM000032S12079  [mRNA]  locus=s32:391211:394011:+ [translate_table: standard]
MRPATPAMARRASQGAPWCSRRRDLGAAMVRRRRRSAASGPVLTMSFWLAVLGLAVLHAAAQAVPGLQLFGGRGRPGDPKTVFVAGATGQTGTVITAELLHAGFKVRAGVPDLGRAQQLAEFATEYGVITKEEARRLNVVEFDIDNVEQTAKVIGNASKVVVTLGPGENGPDSGYGTTDAVRLVEAASLARAKSFTVISQLGGRVATSSSPGGFLAGLRSLFGGGSRNFNESELLDRLVESDLAYAVVRTGSLDRGESKGNVVITAEGTAGRTGSISRSQVATFIAAALSDVAVIENKIVEVVAKADAPETSITEQLSGIAQDPRRAQLAEERERQEKEERERQKREEEEERQREAKRAAEEEAQAIAAEAREKEEAANQLEAEAKVLTAEQARVSSAAARAQARAESAASSVDGLTGKLKEVGGPLPSLGGPTGLGAVLGSARKGLLGGGAEPDNEREDVEDGPASSRGFPSLNLRGLLKPKADEEEDEEDEDVDDIDTSSRGFPSLNLKGLLKPKAVKEDDDEDNGNNGASMPKLGLPSLRLPKLGASVAEAGKAVAKAPQAATKRRPPPPPAPKAKSKPAPRAPATKGVKARSGGGLFSQETVYIDDKAAGDF